MYLFRNLVILGVSTYLFGCSTHHVPSILQTSPAVKSWAPAVPLSAENNKPLSTQEDGWFTTGDPTLFKLVNLSQNHNPQLNSIKAQIVQANAATKVRHTSPRINLGATSPISHSTASTSSLNATLNGQINLEAPLDFWGVNSNLDEIANLKYKSLLSSFNTARVDLAYDVMGGYLDYRNCIQSLDLTREFVVSSEKTKTLIEAKTVAGFLAGTDLNRAKGTFADANTTLVTRTEDCDMSLNKLAYLIGLPVYALKQELGPLTEPPLLIFNSPSGLSANLLRQKPSIKGAEQAFLAADIELANATLARLPVFSIASLISVTTPISPSGTLFKVLGLTPQLGLNLVDNGSIAANVSTSQAKVTLAALNYELELLRSIRDIDNALSKLASNKLKVDSVDAAVTQYSAYLDKASLRYKAGLISLMELEDAKRLVLTTRQKQLSLSLELAQSWITLYKSLGGGWPSSTWGSSDAH